MSNDKKIWRQHGYMFSIFYGVTFGGLLMGSFKLLNVPTNVPLRDTWGWKEFSLWLGYAALASVVSYFAARFLSDFIKKIFHIS